MMANSKAVSDLSIQNVASEYHFPVKGKRLFGEITPSRSGQEMYKMSLEHLVTLESEEGHQ